MSKYKVVIHYEGAYNCEVEAQNEEEAQELAKNNFEDTSVNDIWESVDWDICDTWEIQ